ncbi:hypothetical protein JIR001_21640 [Polycladomyces abyssicola]|uniref:Spore germination protein n=1 Tax=Polycladomyces abyssicola TaxID=1125966 RepID=A0A8D5ZPH5_9BACL|nr:spore germination protein [Polycladomyces abyssicola]BCU82381.1 hypothetical protein JIR001_21640 [Polycladomyces abyssicola]
MIIKLGVLKVNAVTTTSSITVGTHLTYYPFSLQKNNVGTSTTGDHAVIRTVNPIVDPDVNDHPVLIQQV